MTNTSIKKLEYGKVKAQYDSKYNQIDDAATNLETIKKDIADSKKAKVNLTKLNPIYAEYQKKLSTLENLRKIKEQYDKSVRQKEVAMKAISFEKQKINSDIKKLNKQINENKRELESKNKEIEQLDKFSKRSEKGLTKLNERIVKLTKQKETKLKTLAVIDQQIKHSKAQIKDLEENKSKIEKQETNECPVCKQTLKKMTRLDLLKHYTKEISNLKRNSSKLKKAYSINEQSIKKITSTIEKLDVSRRELHSIRTKIGKKKAFEERVKSIDIKLKELLKEKTKLELDLSKNNYSLQDRERLKQVVQTIENLNFDKKLFESLQRYIKNKKGIEEEKGRLENQANRLPSLFKRYDEFKSKLFQLNLEFRNLGKGCKTLTKFAKKYELFDNQRKALDEQIKVMIKDITACETQIKEMESKLSEINTLKDQFKLLQEEVEKQTTEILAYAKLQEIFGKNGIPTQILREIIPDIDRESSTLLRQISNGRLDTSLDFGTKDEIIIRAIDMNGEHPIFRFSGGERMRINLALRLGISEVIAKRKGSKGKLETLVIDEGFGQLDAEGRKAVIDILNPLSEKFRKIIIMSHIEDVKDAFETKLLVENVGGYSKIKFVT